MSHKNYLIVGAGEAGKDVLREILKIDKRNRVVGFIDDDLRKYKTKVEGVLVLGGKKNIKQIVKSKKVDEVIIAIPSADGEQISEIVKICTDARVSFRIVPRVREIIEGAAHFNTIRKVQVEDLLGRPVVKSDVSGLKKFFRGKVVLVTGAAGSIGSELSRQIAAYKPKELVFVDWWENGMFEHQREISSSFPKVSTYYYIANIQNPSKLQSIFKNHKPNYVFHTAAYKHVPLMEENPDEAVKNNIFGTMNVANISIENKVERFVQVSTDKAAKPINVMGVTKLIAEALVKDLNTKGKTKFMIVRFGNVLGSNGSVIPLFKKQIELGGPVTVTDINMTRYFMTISEASSLIIKSSSMGSGGELFVLDMGEPVKIIDLAENMIRLSGYVPYQDIKIVFTGKRRGEKINEILFNDKEKLVSTKDGKIFKTESLGISNSKAKKVVKKFEVLVNKNKLMQIRREFEKLYDK